MIVPGGGNGNGAEGGYGLFQSGSVCNASPVLIGTIPAGTIIPPRGHFLFTGSAYSLKDYGGADAAVGDASLSGDLEANRNFGLFATTDVNAISLSNRFDAVGFGSNTGSSCDLLREGTNVAALTTNLSSLGQHSYFRQICAFQSDCPTPGRPKDTDNNSADFIFADTNGTNTSAGPRLGAPGPENLLSPIKRDPQVNWVLLDATLGKSAAPNRTRDSTSDPANASQFGTMTIRGRVVNQTGAPITRLRFRIIDMTTWPSGDLADLRVRNSPGIANPGLLIADALTCAGTGTPTTAPCVVTVKSTQLEQSPNQPVSLGGGLNSTLSVNLDAPLPDAASINVEFRLGVQRTGYFRFYVVIEANSVRP